jgi:flavodoxin
MKILVTYYSRTGTTKAVGEAIAKELGADCEEIVDLKRRTGLRPIRFLIAGYDAFMRRLTDISVKRNPQDYELIIIGTPIWAGKMTPAVRMYLTSQRLDGKKVCFFCTGGGPGVEKTFEEARRLTPDSTVIGNLALTAGEVKSGSFLEKVKTFVEDLKR